MDKFSDFISEQKNEQPYRVLNLIHDTPDDPNNPRRSSYVLREQGFAHKDKERETSIDSDQQRMFGSMPATK